MTKEELAIILSTRLPKVKLSPTYIKRYKKFSDWSRIIHSEKGQEYHVLTDTFSLKTSDRLKQIFDSAVSGDGDEKEKIMTLHSSSLCAFLHFSAINEANPFRFGTIDYTKVLFEVKNDVIVPSDRENKPSNIDVLLFNQDCKHLLFLESKFTEYLSGGKATLADKYRVFYEALMSAKHGRGFSFKASEIDNKYCLNNGDPSHGYLGGIKQAFCHLLGIATGACVTQSDGNNGIYTQNLLENAESITFASIAFNCDSDKFSNYSELYNSTFQKANIGCIKDALLKVVPDSENTIKKLHIHPLLLSYQEQFKDIELSERVREYYSNIE